VKNQLEVLVSEMNSTGILYAEAVREFKKVFIANVLEQNKGNQCKAAKQLGMHRNTLSRTLAELDLDVRASRRTNADGLSGRRPPRSAQPASLEKKASR
jgi:Fis family transcriptional regulator